MGRAHFGVAECRYRFRAKKLGRIRINLREIKVFGELKLGHSRDGTAILQELTKSLGKCDRVRGCSVRGWGPHNSRNRVAKVDAGPDSEGHRFDSG